MQVLWFMCTGIRPLGDVMVAAPAESVRVDSNTLPSRTAESESHGEILASALLAGLLVLIVSVMQSKYPER